MSKPQLPIETMDAAEVATLLRAGKLLLIDVREPAEFQAERIAGALLYPLSTFDAAALPEDGVRKVVFHCGSGKRSLTAAELVSLRGSDTPRTWVAEWRPGRRLACPWSHPALPADPTSAHS